MDSGGTTRELGGAHVPCFLVAKILVVIFMMKLYTNYTYKMCLYSLFISNFKILSLDNIFILK